MSLQVLVVGASPSADAGHVAGLSHAADMVIAADGGAATCLEAGVCPDIVMGDFDSVSAEVLEACREKGARVIRYPVEKDASDLDLAVGLARDSGYDRLVLTGVSGGRLDHCLAAIGTLERAADLTAVIDEPGIRAWVLHEQGRRLLNLRGPSTPISVFALTDHARARSKGLRHTLDGVVLERLASRGMSNTVEGDRASIVVLSGTLLVVSVQAGGPSSVREA